MGGAPQIWTILQRILYSGSVICLCLKKFIKNVSSSTSHKKTPVSDFTKRALVYNHYSIYFSPQLHGKGTLFINIQNTGRWHYSVLGSRRGSYVLMGSYVLVGSYVLIRLPSCLYYDSHDKLGRDPPLAIY